MAKVLKWMSREGATEKENGKWLKMFIPQMMEINGTTLQNKKERNKCFALLIF